MLDSIRNATPDRLRDALEVAVRRLELLNSASARDILADVKDVLERPRYYREPIEPGSWIERQRGEAGSK